jgi:hypothetical protein
MIAFRLPSCPDRTAITIVKLESSRTQVLSAPIVSFKLLDATANTYGHDVR